MIANVTLVNAKRHTIRLQSWHYTFGVEVGSAWKPRESLWLLKGEVQKLLLRTVENVAIDKALDARDFAAIGMLPECPLALVFELLDIVVRYPIGIGVELGRVEVIDFELVTSIKYGLHAILFFDNIEPSLNISAQLFGCQIALLFDVQDGRQIARFKLGNRQVELRLPSRTDAWNEEMISASDQVVSLGVGKVSVEVVVEQHFALRRLDEDEADGSIPDGGIAKFFPIDALLIVADVNTSHFVAGRISRFAINGTPAEAERTDEKMVEQAYVNGYYKQSAKPYRPGRKASEKTQEAEPTGRFLALPAGLLSLTARLPSLRTTRSGLCPFLCQVRIICLVPKRGSSCIGRKPRLVPSTGWDQDKCSKCSLPILHACLRRT